MPFAPSVNDRSGEIFASGLSSAFDSIARGIVGYRQEQKKKEAEDAAVSFLKQNGARYGFNVNDDKELKAAVKAAGGGPQALQVFQSLEEHEQRKAAAEQHRQYVGMQMQQMQAAQQRNAQDEQAIAAAVAPRPLTASEGLYVKRNATRDPSDQEVVAGYLRNKGSLKGASDLADTVTALEKVRRSREKFTPTLLDLGNGITAMTTSAGSAVPITKGEGKAPKPFSPAGKLLADADALEATGRKDDAALLRKIASKGDDEKPMTLTDYLISGGDASDYRAYVESLKAGGGAAATAISQPAKPKGDAEAVSIASQAEFDKLKPGTRFTFNGRIGVKK